MKVVARKKIWLSISGSLMTLSLLALLIWGLKPGIDFTGGSLLRIKFNGVALDFTEIREAINNDELSKEEGVIKEEPVANQDPLLKNLETAQSVGGVVGNWGEITIQAIGEKEVLIKMRSLSEPEHQTILTRLRQKALEKKEGMTADKEGMEIDPEELVEERDFQSIGSKIGQELKDKSKLAVFWVLIAILIYVAWAFWGIASGFNKYESFRFGAIAIVALAHDILITLGFFAVLGQFWGVEINSFFIAALLTILGYSVNDTIIIFDRIRENILRGEEDDFGKLVDKSINNTLTRSINTSLTTLVTLVAVLVWGGESTFYFALALIVGISLGTYSSIFVASPLLVWWKEKRG